MDLATFGFNTQEFSMVGGYTENLEKQQNYQNWGVGACSGQYGSIEFRTVPQPQDFTQHWYYQCTNAFCSLHVCLANLSFMEEMYILSDPCSVNMCI